ncbi:MAG TPA: hypothetical protein VGH27_24230 [Streptosporangiaceae bacterium]|jgi:hypothetical protein
MAIAVPIGVARAMAVAVPMGVARAMDAVIAWTYGRFLSLCRLSLRDHDHFRRSLEPFVSPMTRNSPTILKNDHEEARWNEQKGGKRTRFPSWMPGLAAYRPGKR